MGKTFRRSEDNNFSQKRKFNRRVSQVRKSKKSWDETPDDFETFKKRDIRLTPRRNYGYD